MSKSEVITVRMPVEIYAVISALASQTSANRNAVMLDLITSSPNYIAYVRGNQQSLNLPVSSEEKLDVILSRLDALLSRSSPPIDLEIFHDVLRQLEAVITGKEEKIKGFTVNSFSQGFATVVDSTNKLRAALDSIEVQLNRNAPK